MKCFPLLLWSEPQPRGTCIGSGKIAEVLSGPRDILGDPVFVVVCYLLVGAPSALQLTQICQINGVYEAVIARLMFWSYVVVILPSTVAFFFVNHYSYSYYGI